MAKIQVHIFDVSIREVWCCQDLRYHLVNYQSNFESDLISIESVTKFEGLKIPETSVFIGDYMGKTYYVQKIFVTIVYLMIDFLYSKSHLWFSIKVIINTI